MRENFARKVILQEEVILQLISSKCIQILLYGLEVLPMQKYQYEIFNFLDLCCGVGIVWSTTTRTRVSDVTAVTFSVKCFNPWKIYPVRKHLQKVFCFILFIYLRAFNKRNHPAVRPGQSFRACPSSQSEESLT